MWGWEDVEKNGKLIRRVLMEVIIIRIVVAYKATEEYTLLICITPCSHNQEQEINLKFGIKNKIWDSEITWISLAENQNWLLSFTWAPQKRLSSSTRELDTLFRPPKPLHVCAQVNAQANTEFRMKMKVFNNSLCFLNKITLCTILNLK